METLVTLAEDDMHERMRDVISALVHLAVPVPVALPAVRATTQAVLRQLARPTGLSADELLATYREPLMNDLGRNVRLWGARPGPPVAVVDNILAGRHIHLGVDVAGVLLL